MSPQATRGGRDRVPLEEDAETSAPLAPRPPALRPPVKGQPAKGSGKKGQAAGSKFRFRFNRGAKNSDSKGGGAKGARLVTFADEVEPKGKARLVAKDKLGARTARGQSPRPR